ncbi:MAG: hypothetical protein COU07_03225 [Candidatus Harrisonbacteria bacterium CG10_big_fil_rev_8_21_14_0_10_40_38]|uniref:GtrA/DPMS transmembrane domain-containing protein n=1 Tax=Candidatus Harrisonbacteria bacterium CG10_big_fil_rev_8_21_14_0_10_40_38 TaxID=1974583 RepID=A0A2H0UTU8_9BACT|nr:MAG: hypothetical protein COU07_03225 [Candidatus Harrisonbacteria bacterium CG10_big_fil_rev_8_21_14_0_10_40_38]
MLKRQITRYLIIGIPNAAIDFGFVNLASYIFNTYKGPLIIPINFGGFFFATLNSYFMNKFWNFQDGEKTNPKQMSVFFGVAAVGAIVNTAILYLLTTFIPLDEVVGKEIWLNVAKLFATVIQIILNFVGYKFVVFKN